MQIFSGKVLLSGFLTIVGMAVLGSRMAQAEHPFFAAASISQPFRSQRADALYLLVFVMLCVFRITIYTVLAAHLLQLRFPKLRYASTICLILMLGCTAIPGIFAYSAVWNPIFLTAAAILIPSGFLLCRRNGGAAA